MGKDIDRGHYYFIQIVLNSPPLAMLLTQNVLIMPKLKGNFIRVVDGDTAWVAIKVRLSNVMAAELPTAAGKKHKTALKKWAKLNDDHEILMTGGIDDFGRLLGICYSVNDGQPYRLPE